MTEKRKQHITLQLDAHRVAMDIPSEQEEIYRSAASYVNERYRRYLKKMPSLSAEELWVYVALDAAVNYHANANEHSMVPVEEKVLQLKQKISDALRQTETEE